MTFPLDYHSKNDLRPSIMFIVETANRNPHVKKDIICDKAQKLKTTFGMQRHLMYSSNIKNMNICCKMLRFICKIYAQFMQIFSSYFLEFID